MANSVFHGGKDRQIANSMLRTLGGDEGYRQRITVAPDGTVTTLRTKDGMPNVEVKRPQALPDTAVRGFVFNRRWASLATVASMFVVATRNLPVSTPVGYSVANYKSVPTAKWCDVVRLDGGGVKVNGRQLASGPTTVPIFTAWAIPVVTHLTAFLPAGASPLYVSTPNGVSWFNEDGTVRDVQALSSGPMQVSWLTADDRFHFLGGYSSSSQLSANSKVTWGRIAYGVGCSTEDDDSVLFNDAYFSAPATGDDSVFSWNNGYFNIGQDGTGPFAYDDGNSTSSAHGASFSASEAVDTVTLSVSSADQYAYAYNVFRTGGGLWYFSGSRNDHSDLSESKHSSRSIVVTDLHSDPAHLFRERADTSSSASGDLPQTLVHSENGTGWQAVEGAPAANSDSSSIYATAIDFIFVDRANEVFISLEVEVANGEYGGTTIAGRYVLEVRGVRHEFPCFSKSTPATLQGGVASIPGVGGSRTAATYPSPFFVPKYMGQETCPYVAYTTRAEEALGTAPEIYIDVALYPIDHYGIDGPASPSTLPTDVCTFAPPRMSYIFAQYLYTKDGWVDEVFKEAVRIQFANGVIGPWAQRLGGDFTENDHLEISRI